jgi:hypothetical protein
MARVPALPYRVYVTVRTGPGTQRIETHNYPDLPGAWTYRDIALRRQSTRKVEISLVLDESTPTHRDSAVDFTRHRSGGGATNGIR